MEVALNGIATKFAAAEGARGPGGDNQIEWYIYKHQQISG